MADISDRLKQVRTRLGYTQKEMSGTLEVAYRTLQDNERALVQPSATTLAAYAAIGVDLNWLITGIEQYPRASLVQPADELRVKKKSVLTIKAFSDGAKRTSKVTPELNGKSLLISKELLPFGGHKTVSSNNLVWVTQSDESMAPEIPKGAKLVVALGSTAKKKTAIYLLRRGRRLVARKVAETKDGYIVVSAVRGNVEAVFPITERASIDLIGIVRQVIRSA